MAIQGEYPDGGYEIWCEGCGGKITCFSLAEIFCLTTSSKVKFLYYERFKCKECREVFPINTDEILTDYEEKLFDELESRWNYIQNQE